jgi:hypothetical protein
MTSFLAQVAGWLHNKYGDNLQHYGLVFPNKRAGLFFSKYLAQYSNDKPIWAPEFLTINELFLSLSSLKLTDNLNLLFELHRVFKIHTQSNESFDDFYYWGEALLSDFDDVDKYMVNTSDLFQNIRSLKNIRQEFEYLSEKQLMVIHEFFHNFNPDTPGKHKDEFIKIWEVLLPIYQTFTTQLKEKGIAYEGMIFRDATERMKSGIQNDLPLQRYMFIGFNALNACEHKLFSWLSDCKKADFFWDYDEYYLKKEYHQAGFFLRSNISSYPPPEGFDVESSPLSKQSKIDIISVPSSTAQARLIPQILTQHGLHEGSDLNQTAIVLADEQLLMPTLYSIPQWIEDINITMGYPLNQSTIASLVLHLLELQNTCKTSNNHLYFYHKPVLSILNHQYIILLFGSDATTITEELNAGNLIFIEKEVLDKNDFFNMIFSPATQGLDVNNYLNNILHELFNKLQSDASTPTGLINRLEAEFISCYQQVLVRLGSILNSSNENISLKTYTRLLRKIVNGRRVPFTGEPLLGLQLMGILETRAIDFEHVVLLSMNEGIYPRAIPSVSFIPGNLRRGFGLPTPEQHDAMYAYYFYRLIQRATQVTLLYNTAPNLNGPGEMSRFISQLCFDKKLDINRQHVNFDIRTRLPNPIIIERNDTVVQKLNDRFCNTEAGKYISPNALNTWLDCRLKFYFRYIEGLDEPERLTEELDAALFGNVLHTTMQQLYEPYISDTINSSTLETLSEKQNIRKAVDKAIAIEFFKDKLNTNNQIAGGNVQLLTEVVCHYTAQILMRDKQYAPFNILSLEEKHEIKIQLTGSHNQVVIAGRIDRIDCKEGLVRILDYKSGRVEHIIPSLESLFDPNQEKRNHAAFQLLLYCYIFYQSKQPNEMVKPGLVSLRKTFDDSYDGNLQIQAKPIAIPILDFIKILPDFEEKLKQLLIDILNSEISFDQTNNAETCKYCPYSAICHH